MAFVPFNGRTGWFVTIVMIDRNEDEARREFELTASTPDDAITEGKALAVEYANLTQCNIVARHISYRDQNDSIVVPSAGEVQTKAIVTLRLEGGNEKATLDIPAPVETMFLALTGANNKVVNTTFPALTTFVNNLKVGAAQTALISDGESVKEIIRGKKA